MSAHDVVAGIIADAVVDFIKRVCECERLKEVHVRDLELAKIAEEVTRVISEGREGEFGPVVIKVQKKFLGRREVKAFLFSREVDVNTLLGELSKARSRAAWISSDCSDHALIEPLYKYEDRYLIEVVQRNFEKFRLVCGGQNPEIDFDDAPAHVVEGVKKGVASYLASHGAGN